MNHNDIKLAELVLQVQKLAGQLDMLMRDGSNHSLFMALYKIRNHADDAMFRLNQLEGK